MSVNDIRTTYLPDAPWSWWKYSKLHF